MKVINKDIYYAIFVLGASSIITGLIMVIMGETGLVIGLGATKLVIAIPILAYTIKHKVGQRQVVQKQVKRQKTGRRFDGTCYSDSRRSPYAIGTYDVSDKY